MRFTKQFFVGVGVILSGWLAMSTTLLASTLGSSGELSVLGGVEGLRSGWVKVEFRANEEASLLLEDFLRFQHELTFDVDSSGRLTWSFYLDEQGDARNALPQGVPFDGSVILGQSSFRLFQGEGGAYGVVFQSALIGNRFSGRDLSCKNIKCGYTLGPLGTVDPLF